MTFFGLHPLDAAILLVYVKQPWGEERHRVAADQAYAALAGKISPEGELLGASGGTPVMPLASDYNAIPFAVTAFSQGLAILAFCL